MVGRNSRHYIFTFSQVPALRGQTANPTIRYYWDGTPVPNNGHNTGQFVEPIDKATFLPPRK